MRQGPLDALTALPERAQLRLAMDRALRARPVGAEIAVAVLGLDRFSGVNAALGRSAGNDVLRVVADRLGILAGTAARLGGDEFAVLVTGASARRVGDAVADALRRPIEVAGRSIFLGASIGVACAPDDANDPETLLQHADTAMQLAKERGGGLVLPFAGELRDEVEERLAIASGLQEAIERGELVLHYQPIVETATRRLVGMEALVRWQHPTLGLISPDRFIPIAEDNGLIVPLGHWVLSEACRQTADWQRFMPLRVAVNLSPRQFEHERVDEVVAEALRTSGLAPRLLEVELTERAELHDDNAVVAVLQRLRDLGVTCAVDDFGTGYGGLSYLIRYPIAQLKIDRSFVQAIDSDHDHAVIVAGLIRLARELGMEVVAEGVERPEQAEFLTRHGCTHFQGYLVSRPLTAEAFHTLLSRGELPATDRQARRVPALTAPTRPAPVRPGPRRDRRRRLPAIVLSAAAGVVALAGSTTVPALGAQTIAAVVHHVEAALPQFDIHERRAPAAPAATDTTAVSADSSHAPSTATGPALAVTPTAAPEPGPQHGAAPTAAPAANAGASPSPSDGAGAGAATAAPSGPPSSTPNTPVAEHTPATAAAPASPPVTPPTTPDPTANGSTPAARDASAAASAAASSTGPAGAQSSRSGR